MSNLERKRAALKALKELRRTNPDQYAVNQQQKTEQQAQLKRYLVQAKCGEIWKTLDTTDNQGEAVQFVIEFRWAKINPNISWKVIDTQWLTTNRGKSVVMWVRGDNPAANTDSTTLPAPPLFPLASFIRVSELNDTIDPTLE